MAGSAWAGSTSTATLRIKPVLQRAKPPRVRATVHFSTQLRTDPAGRLAAPARRSQSSKRPVTMLKRPTTIRRNARSHCTERGGHNAETAGHVGPKYPLPSLTRPFRRDDGIPRYQGKLRGSRSVPDLDLLGASVARSGGPPACAVRTNQWKPLPSVWRAFSSVSTLLRLVPTFATASLTNFCVTPCFCARYFTS